jgi:predicted nucleic acid-binding protein
LGRRCAKFGVPRDAADEYVRLPEQNSVVAKTAPLPGINPADRDDLPILGAAVASGADVFVTGDLEPHELQAVGRLQILSPRGFWDKLRSRRPRK